MKRYGPLNSVDIPDLSKATIHVFNDIQDGIYVDYVSVECFITHNAPKDLSISLISPMDTHSVLFSSDSTVSKVGCLFLIVAAVNDVFITIILLVLFFIAFLNFVFCF
jgi:hypothetical protein